MAGIIRIVRTSLPNCARNLACSFATSTRTPEQALPDCIGRIDGQCVGIEVTRLTIAPEDIAWQRNCLRSNIEALCLGMERDDSVRAGKIRYALEAKPFKFASALKHIFPHEQVLITPPWPKWPFDYFQDRLRAVIREKRRKRGQQSEGRKA